MLTAVSVELSGQGWALLSFMTATVLPLLVGLVTTRSTSPGVRAVLLAVLASANGLITELLASHAANQPYDLFSGALTALAAFLVAVGMHFGLWRPTGAADAAQGVGSSS